jgi:DNA-binding GntR family transcriptional regulator
MITVWAALESMAARLATKVASDEDIRALHGLVDQFSSDEIARHMGEYSDANIRFHQAIIRLSENPLIVDITNGLFFHVRAIRQRTIFEQDRAKRSIADHKEVVEALEAREAERAERLVRDHTLRLRDHVERHMDLD